jgi:hypothetical protein
VDPDPGMVLDHPELFTATLSALHLAGRPVTKNWPERTAALVWRSIGGE